MCAIVISIGRPTNILSSSLVLQFEQFWDSWGCLVPFNPLCTLKFSWLLQRNGIFAVIPYSILDTYGFNFEIYLANIVLRLPLTVRFEQTFACTALAGQGTPMENIIYQCGGDRTLGQSRTAHWLWDLHNVAIRTMIPSNFTPIASHVMQMEMVTV